MARRIFRTADTPAGHLAPESLHLRVRAALEDMQADGLAVRFDPLAIEMGQDQLGDWAAVDLEWPDGARTGQALPYIQRRHVRVDD